MVQLVRQIMGLKPCQALAVLTNVPQTVNEVAALLHVEVARARAALATLTAQKLLKIHYVKRRVRNQGDTRWRQVLAFTRQDEIRTSSHSSETLRADNASGS